MKPDNTINAFFALLRAGLWEKDVLLSSYGEIDNERILLLSEEQSVMGLVAAGIEHVVEGNISQEIALQFAGQSLQLEQRNVEMNDFVATLVRKLRKNDIYALLVKGQGIAQCYERPLWRTSGDVDFYLSDTDFTKAKAFFRPFVDTIDPDNETAQHINMHYGSWIVEIHANQHSTLSFRINRVLDEIHYDLFYNGKVRSWEDCNTQVFLPSPDNDALIVFTHFLKHFYIGGIGLRQICDWCRLLWTYRETIDLNLLENRLKKMGLFRIWKAFGYFAVYYLGMPKETMPFFSSDKCLKRKAEIICCFILEVGNFGHNRDMSYYEKYPRLIRKCFSMWFRCKDSMRHLSIFPLETLRFFPCIIYNGIHSAVNGD